MDSNSHFFLGLAADLALAASCRMSLLIEASNLRVGTFSNNSFLPLSIGGVL
jgi:hypothetical protein